MLLVSYVQQDVFPGFEAQIPRKAQAIGVPSDNLRVMLGRRLSVSLEVKMSVVTARCLREGLTLDEAGRFGRLLRGSPLGMQAPSTFRQVSKALQLVAHRH